MFKVPPGRQPEAVTLGGWERCTLEVGGGGGGQVREVGEGSRSRVQECPCSSFVAE